MCILVEDAKWLSRFSTVVVVLSVINVACSHPLITTLVMVHTQVDLGTGNVKKEHERR